VPLLVTFFVRWHSRKKLFFLFSFATASLPLKMTLLTSAIPVQPQSIAKITLQAGNLPHTKMGMLWEHDILKEQALSTAIPFG